MVNELSLFTGYGGMTLGLKLTGLPIRTVAYVEIEPYCQEIIKARIRDGYLDDAPIWNDIRTFRGEQFRGLVDIITAGFPCQPHSVAGKRAGALDNRNLWPDTLRVIDGVGPGFVLLENVPGILANGYAGTVVGELAERGYDATWGLLSASSVGAPHIRKRWWCLAYPNNRRYTSELGETIPWWEETPAPDTESSSRSTDRDSLFIPIGSEDVADTPSSGLAYSESRSQSTNDGDTCYSPERSSWWFAEPGMGRMANGTPYRVDRLKALGNGVVPACVALFLKRISKMA